MLTTGRQDWGLLRSTCERLREDPAFDLRLIAGGMHCSRRFGLTVETMRSEGFVPDETLRWIPDDRPASAAEQAGAALLMVGEALARLGAEALLLAGDRFETAAGAVAATLAGIPLVHLHGGEETEGAFDNNLRHAITKLSHLHLVSHPEYGARVVAMGEDPTTVHVVGAPGLDNLHRSDLASRGELETFLKLELRPPVVVVTLHPATQGGDPAREAAAVCSAMDAVGASYVITLPNADPGNDLIRRALEERAALPGRAAVEALGERRFWGLLRLADAMLGNSSSALIEAPVLGLPAVNVGDRQKGRIRGANVVDVPPEAEAAAAALRRVLDPAFRASLRGVPSPFGDGHAGSRIHGILKTWQPPRPPVKRGVTRAAP